MEGEKIIISVDGGPETVINNNTDDAVVVETTEPVVDPPAVDPPVQADPPDASIDQPAPAAQQPVVEYDPYEALGFERGDANAKKVLDAYRTGKLKEYIDISSRDYNTVSDVDLIRQDIAEKYHMVPKEDQELIFKNKYNLTGDEDADRLANIMIKADAHAMRQTKITEQQNYTIPEYKAPEQQVDPNAQKQIDEFINTINTDPIMTAFESNRQVRLGTGDDAYNFETPKSFDLKKAILSPDGLFAAVVENVNGAPKLNMQKLQRLANYAYHMDDVESALINHGKTLGARKSFEELRNPQEDPATVPPKQAPKYEVVS